MNLMSPSDIVGPSPVTSNGTETTEIEDEEAEESDAHVVAHASSPPQPTTEEAVSVIHAPESFQAW
ncbi:hypothetical protein HYQ45_018858 [Verticillium longisporum]|uniref:Uncharacterized protein n=1 Tax=Verticillium longisporum TaxID=100787 RepID=A0A8I2ZTJ8_VERLO|nr:hypothetical protein HYQ45_018858 [Verticillium longisporum]